MEIVLVKEKETPGTWRFKENKEDHPKMRRPSAKPVRRGRMKSEVFR